MSNVGLDTKKRGAEIRARMNTNEAAIFECIAECGTKTELLEWLSASPRAFYRWVHKRPDREQAFKEAREASAWGYAEKSIKVLVDALAKPDLTTAQASVVRELSKRLAWMAERFGPIVFAEAPETVVKQLDIGALHLKALLRHGSMDFAPRGEEIDGGAPLLPESGEGT